MDREEPPLEIPVGDVFDLHTVPPRDAKDVVEAYLEEAHRKGLRALRIIHGRGIGVQREMVRNVLARTPFVRSFSDAPLEAGGWGATVVTLGEDDMPAASIPLGDELTQLLLQYDAVLRDAESMVSPMTAEQFNWREDAQRWSVGQCLEHLSLTGLSYAKKVRVAIDEGKRRGLFATGPFRYGWLETWFLRLTEPPPRFRAKAPKVFRPTTPQGDSLDPKTSLMIYRDNNRLLRALVEEANGLDLRRIKTSSPATDLLQFSVGVILAIIPAHDRRHLWQARQVMSSPGFPQTT